MNSDAKLIDEPARLAALSRYEVMDTPGEAPFDRITGLVQTIFQIPIAIVSLIDAERQWFKSCVGLGATQTSREVSFCTHTIQGRQPMFVPDTLLDPRFAENILVTGEPYIRSYLGVPLSTPDGYNLGSLCAIDIRPRRYTPDQIQVMKSFAALVMDELELRRIARTDHLTGAASRGDFCSRLERALSLYNRDGVASSLLILDIDHFKQVNDTYGHPAGDRVLQAVSAALQAQLGDEDLLGRLGGEEFGVLLHGVALPKAMEAAECYRRAIETTCVANNPPLRVTASFGACAIQPDHISPEEWMAAADAALYDAKKSGRNRCCFVDGRA